MGRIRQIAAMLGQLSAEGPDGVQDAVRRKLARHSGVDSLRSVVEAQAAELDRLRADLAATAETAERVRADRDALAVVVEGLTARIDGLDPLHTARDHMTRWLEDHNRTLRELDSRLLDVERLPASLGGWLRGHDTAFEGLHARVDELESGQAVRVFSHWIDQLDLADAPKITVVMPTHNRARLLPRAVGSVLAQSYANWELVIVDDASADDTPEVLAAIDDPRIRSLRTRHGGVCAARNAGLDAATGDVIAYLDDDNTMHPLWLKAVAWAFGKHAEVDTVYGGFVIDDIDRVHGKDGGSLPRLMLRRYSRAVLLRENLADIGAVAHRNGLPAGRFDESLREMGDWDLLCGLTADSDPLVLPAIACFYTTNATDRLSNGPTYDADFAAIRRKHAPDHPAE